MATAKDLIPQKYEVLKTRTGAEIVGMTRDIGNNVEVTLPMICQLSVIPNTNRTHVVFYPYSPLSRDERIVMPRDHIVHRSRVNQQFIPLYDGASSKWLKMIDEESIPLGEPGARVPIDQNIDQRIRDAMERLAEQYDLDFEEHDEEWGFSKDEEYDDFYDAEPPTDPKKIH